MRAQRPARQMLAVAFANLAPPVSAFAVAPLLAQSLGVAGRGEVSAATSLLLLFTAIGTVGLPEAVNYFVASRPTARTRSTRHAIWMLSLSGAALSGLSIAIAPFLASGDEDLQSLIVISSLAITPTVVIGALRGTAQGSQKWGIVNAEKYIGSTARLLAVVLLFASDGLTPLNATIVLATSPIIGGIAYVALIGRSTTLVQDFVGPRNLAAYGSLIWVGSLSGVLLSRVDQVLMNPLAGAFQLGLYAVAVSVADILLITNSAIRDVMFSVDARDRNDERVYLAARVSLLTATATGILIAGTVWWWLPLLFGSEVTPAIPVTMVLILATVLGVPGSIGGAALSARGKPGLRSTALLIAAIVNICALILLAPTFGAFGAAVATLIGNALAANLNLIFLSRKFGMSASRFYAIRPADARMMTQFIAAYLSRKATK